MKEKTDTRVDDSQYGAHLSTAASNEPVWPLWHVAVFVTDRGPGRKPLHMAYTRYYNPAWDGCCLHHVRAKSGYDAKRRAIAMHKSRLSCGLGVYEQQAITQRPGGS